MVREGFSAAQVCALVGVSYRQIDYWDRTNLLRPTLQPARGSGSRRRYSYGDVMQLKVIRRLLDAGVSLPLIRHAVEFLRGELGDDLASATLVLNGSRSVLVRREGELLDVVRQGQGVLSIVSLGPLSTELDAAIATIESPTAGGASETSAA